MAGTQNSFTRSCDKFDYGNGTAAQCQGTHSYPVLSNSQQPGWQIVKNNKKRQRENSSPENTLKNTKQTKIVDYWLNKPAATSNQYEALNSDQQQLDNDQENNQTPKPPPIFVSSVKYIVPLTTLLKEIVDDNFELKILRNDEVKVQAKNTESYSAIIKALKDKNTEFHTYKIKQDRSFRVVLKNIHSTTDTTTLTDAIEAQGHKVVNLCNIRQRGTKTPLNLFYVELQPQPNNKEIYNIELLLNSKVTFEPPHQKREIPQCTNCQRYGHTKKYCNRPSRCVKCTGNHKTSDCHRQGKNNDVQCVLCEGNHPANYKGCAIYKELQMKKYPPLRPKQIINQTTTTALPAKQTGTYAQAARENLQPIQSTNNVMEPRNTVPNHSNDIQELKGMMKALMEQMGIMLNLLTTLVSKMSQ